MCEVCAMVEKTDWISTLSGDVTATPPSSFNTTGQSLLYSWVDILFWNNHLFWTALSASLIHSGPTGDITILLTDLCCTVEEESVIKGPKASPKHQFSMMIFPSSQEALRSAHIT
ncbi:hypothetical protein F7725_016561, partial [Dissostichus mawsoni]